jgi:hypothetical protein
VCADPAAAKSAIEPLHSVTDSAAEPLQSVADSAFHDLLKYCESISLKQCGHCIPSPLCYAPET